MTRAWQKRGEKFVGRHQPYPEYRAPHDPETPPPELAEEAFEDPEEAASIQESRQDPSPRETGENKEEKSVEGDSVAKIENEGEKEPSRNWYEMSVAEEKEEKAKKMESDREVEQRMTGRVAAVAIVPLSPSAPDPVTTTQSRLTTGEELQELQEAMTRGGIPRRLGHLRLRDSPPAIAALTSASPRETEKMEIEVINLESGSEVVESGGSEEERASRRAQLELDSYLQGPSPPTTAVRAEESVASILQAIVQDGSSRILRVPPTLRPADQQRNLRVLPVESQPTGPMGWDVGDWEDSNDSPGHEAAAVELPPMTAPADGAWMSKRRKKMNNPRRQLTKDDYFPAHLPSPPRAASPPPGPPIRRDEPMESRVGFRGE